MFDTDENKRCKLVVILIVLHLPKKSWLDSSESEI